MDPAYEDMVAIGSDIDRTEDAGAPTLEIFPLELSIIASCAVA